MFAAIPAPRELYGTLVMDNHNPDPLVDIPEAWVLTKDSGLIANAGVSAVLGVDEDSVCKALERQADTPAGFTQYKLREHSKWFDDGDKKAPLFKLCDKLDLRSNCNKDNRNRSVRFLIRQPHIAADTSVDAVNLLSQARVTPAGIRIVGKQLRLIFKPDAKDISVEFARKYENGRYVNIPDNWVLKRTAIVNDNYLVRPSDDGTYVLVYSPSKVKALTTRRKNNVGVDRKPRKTAYQCMLGIINTFATHAWDWSGLTWGLATRNYSTCGLRSCANTILEFTKFARQIGRLPSCRKAYAKDVQDAWFHRRLLTTNTDETFMRWYWQELKLAGKPKDAAVFESQQRLIKKRKAARLAKAQAQLERISVFKGHTKEEPSVK